MELVSLCGISITLAALYRLLAVYNMHQRMAEARVLLAIAVFELLYLVPTIAACAVTGYAVVEEQPHIAQAALIRYPKLASTTQTRLCAFIEYGMHGWWTVMLLASVQMGLLFVVSMGIWFMALVRLGQRRKELSKRSYQLHKQLTIAVAMQFAMPAVVVAVPFMLVDYSLLNGMTLVDSSWSEYHSRSMMHSQSVI